MADRVLFLDDSPERAKAAKAALLCTHVTTAKACIGRLSDIEEWDVLYLDHDLGGDPIEEPSTRDANGDTGMSVVLYLLTAGRQHRKRMRVVVHSLNGPAAERMFIHLKGAGFQVERVPFTRLLQTWRDRSAPGEWVTNA